MKQEKTIVSIIQKTLPHYRVPFFSRLYKKLEDNGMYLNFIYGQGNADDEKKGDLVDVDFGIKINNLYVSRNVIMQPCLFHIKGSALVIAEQANKLLSNYFLIALKKVYRYKLAFWGHGWCFQQDSSSIGNRIKKVHLGNIDHFFAYTHHIKIALVNGGYPSQRITAVQNTIDTHELETDYKKITYNEVRAFLQAHRLPPKCNIGIYCGGMYEEKQIPFLLAALDIVKAEIREFYMFFIGGGSHSYYIKQASRNRPWLMHFGPEFGRKKALLFKAADIMLMPGLVGLAVLDSFVTGTPMITTTYPYHSPEITYIQDGVNGIVTSFDIHAFANEIINALSKPALRKKLKEGALYSAEQYTLDAMVDNFYNGICSCLPDKKA